MLLDAIDTKGKSPFGTGGIATKIEAAGMVNKYGINMILLNGKKKDTIKTAFEGGNLGTLFSG